MQISSVYTKIENSNKNNSRTGVYQNMPQMKAMKNDSVSFQGWGKWLPEKLNILGRTKEQLIDLAEYFTEQCKSDVVNASRINKFVFFKDKEKSDKAYDILYPLVVEAKTYKQGLKDELDEFGKKLKKDMTKDEKKRVKFIQSELERFREKSARIEKEFRAPDTDDGRFDSIDSGFNSILDNPFHS